MSSELKLTGASGGNIILQGNDTITTDQVFTFPDTGGEIATKAAGTPPAVGYQQGAWVPDLDFNYSVSGAFVWWRIGNVVSLQGQVGNFSNRTDTRTIKVYGLPYPSDASVANTNVGVCQTKNTSIPATAVWMLGTDSPQSMAFYKSGDGNAANWAPIKFSETTASTVISWAVSYLTDDTTWTPINGATVS